ncbi:hypothetical protein Tco_0754098 [Tanacetum coccineum]
MEDLNVTMEEYIKLEEEKARRRGGVFSWEIATYGRIRVDDVLHDLRSVEAELPAIVIDDDFVPQDALPCKSQVSTPVNDEIDFRISFDEFDDEDYTIIYDKNSFSYKIIYVNNLKTDSKNDNEKAGIPSFPPPKPTISYVDDLDFFKDFMNGFSAIVYNDAQTSKSDYLTEQTLSPIITMNLNLNMKTSFKGSCVQFVGRQGAARINKEDKIGNKVLREVTGETTTTGVWSKLEILYMTKSLANKLYLKKKFYTFYMPAGRKISEHIDEFNKIVLDLANIKDVMATLNSKEIKERSKAKGGDGEGLYVRGRTDHRDSRQSRVQFQIAVSGGRLKCYIYQFEDHLKRNCLKNNRKKSTGYVKKDEQPSSSGLTYEDSECIIRYIPELNRNLISLGTLEKEGFTLKLQSGKVKVINGSRVVLSRIRRDIAYTLWMAMQWHVSLMLVFKKKTVLSRFGTKDWDISARRDYRCWKSKAVWARKVLGKSSIFYLCGPSQVESLGGKRYFLSIVDYLFPEDMGLNILWFKLKHLESAKRKQLVREQNGRTVQEDEDRYGLGGSCCNRELYRLDDESPKIVTSKNMVFNESVMYKDTLKHSGVDQEDGKDEDAGDQETNQIPDLIDY